MLKNNSNVKRITLLLCALFIAVLSIINPLQVHAASEKLIRTLVDSVSSNGSAGTDTVPNGINQTRTGYLVYLLDMDGNAVSGNNGEAKVFALRPTASGNWIGGSWKCTPRKGYNVNVTNWTDMEKAQDGTKLWWDMLPWNADGGTVTSNEPDIKAWMTTPNAAGTDNVVEFVQQLWKDDGLTEKFSSNQAVLVVETILNLQFSTSRGMTDAEANTQADKAISKFLGQFNADSLYSYLYNHEVPEEIENITNLKNSYDNAKHSGSYIEQMRTLSKLKNAMNNYVKKSKPDVAAKIKEADKSNKYELQGSPVYGTLKCLAEYKENVLHIEKSALDSYVNRRACFAEYIEQGGIGEQVGFRAWDKSVPTTNIENTEVIQYGLGMINDI